MTGRIAFQIEHILRIQQEVADAGLQASRPHQGNENLVYRDFRDRLSLEACLRPCEVWGRLDLMVSASLFLTEQWKEMFAEDAEGN